MSTVPNDLYNRLRVMRNKKRYSILIDKMLALYLKVKAEKNRKHYSFPFDKMFTRICIETRTDCNLKCKFCPQSTNPRPNIVMTEELFKRIIDELAEMNFAGRICPLTNNEPLLDVRIVSFITYARQRCPLSFLEIITNGILLTEELLLELFAAGLDSLIINDYRNDRSEHPFRLSARIDKIAELTQSMFRKKVYISLRSTSEELGSRAGNIQKKQMKTSLNRFCALPFTGLWLQPEGKAILCCQDYSYDEIMGDVTKNSLSEIWFNDKYKRIRRELYEKDRTKKICGKCDYPGAPL